MGPRDSKNPVARSSMSESRNDEITTRLYSIESADQRMNSPDDRVQSDTRAPHRRYNVARGERFLTGCVSGSAASEVHYGWQQKRCRT